MKEKRIIIIKNLKASWGRLYRAEGGGRCLPWTLHLLGPALSLWTQILRLLIWEYSPFKNYLWLLEKHNSFSNSF